MATLYGREVLQWLLERGWQEYPEQDPLFIGDSRVIDPRSGICLDVYRAARIHEERTGEYPDCLKDKQHPA